MSNSNYAFAYKRRSDVPDNQSAEEQTSAAERYAEGLKYEVIQDRSGKAAKKQNESWPMFQQMLKDK